MAVGALLVRSSGDGTGLITSKDSSSDSSLTGDAGEGTVWRGEVVGDDLTDKSMGRSCSTATPPGAGLHRSRSPPLRTDQGAAFDRGSK